MDWRSVRRTHAERRLREGPRGRAGRLDAGLAPVKLNMVVFEPTAGYVLELIDHVAERDGLQLQLIEYMPEIAGRPEWAIDIDRVHDWLEDRADHVETGTCTAVDATTWGSDDAETVPIDASDSEGHSADHGMVEVVDPVENPEFCANCHRVRVTHDGQFKGCLNRHDDHRSTGDMSREEIRAAFEATVVNRVPFYGEYMVEEGGEWARNEHHVDQPVTPADGD